jgi:Ca2+-binding RTX toxin-like protein
MRGGDDNDEIDGGPGSDMAHGDLGGDVWAGHGNAPGDVDHFYGGTGNDRSDFAADAGRQILRGETGDDDLRGGSGSDVILGGPGNDRLAGYLGDDSLRGGSGVDLVDYFETIGDDYPPLRNERPVRVDLQRGRAAGLGLDTLSSIEGAIGGTGKDVLLGNKGPNIFWLGRNYLNGNVLEGDVIQGRGGQDTLTPEDRCCNARGIRVDLASGDARRDPADKPATISSIEIVIGTNLPDVLRGDKHANTLRGRDDDDTISGRGGDDRLAGGTGSDELWGGAGRDLLSGGSGADNLGGGSGRDRNYGGSGWDRCTSPATGVLATSCEQP